YGWPSRPTVLMAVVFPGDEVPMPGEQGIRTHDGSDLPEHLSPQDFSFGGQATALIVGEAQPVWAELFAEHAILGLEIVDDVALVLVDPARQRNHEELERIRERGHELSVSKARSGLIERQAAADPYRLGRGAVWEQR